MPNDTREMPVEAVGDMPNSSTIFVDLKERWTPSSKRMFALAFLFPATTVVTAVLSKQMVCNCSVVRGEAGVRSSVTSVEEVGGLALVTLSCEDSNGGVSLLHNVV